MTPINPSMLGPKIDGKISHDGEKKMYQQLLGDGYKKVFDEKGNVQEKGLDVAKSILTKDGKFKTNPKQSEKLLEDIRAGLKKGAKTDSKAAVEPKLIDSTESSSVKAAADVDSIAQKLSLKSEGVKIDSIDLEAISAQNEQVSSKLTEDAKFILDLLESSGGVKPEDLDVKKTIISLKENPQKGELESSSSGSEKEVPLLDKHGKPILGKDGKPVIKKVSSNFAKGEFDKWTSNFEGEIPVRDEKGNPVLDKNGKPVMQKVISKFTIENASIPDQTLEELIFKNVPIDGIEGDLKLNLKFGDKVPKSDINETIKNLKADIESGKISSLEKLSEILTNPIFDSCEITSSGTAPDGNIIHTSFKISEGSFTSGEISVDGIEISALEGSLTYGVKLSGEVSGNDVNTVVDYLSSNLVDNSEKNAGLSGIIGSGAFDVSSSTFDGITSAGNKLKYNISIKDGLCLGVDMEISNVILDNVEGDLTLDFTLDKALEKNDIEDRISNITYGLTNGSISTKKELVGMLIDLGFDNGTLTFSGTTPDGNESKTTLIIKNGAIKKAK